MSRSQDNERPANKPLLPAPWPRCAVAVNSAFDAWPSSAAPAQADGWRVRVGPSTPTTWRYSEWSASIGSSFAARIAGYIPEATPTTIDTPIDSAIDHVVTTVGQSA
jgi:hypothetical protein